jgi:hypothetical protein
MNGATFELSGKNYLCLGWMSEACVADDVITEDSHPATSTHRSACRSSRYTEAFRCVFHLNQLFINPLHTNYKMITLVRLYVSANLDRHLQAYI